MGVSGEVEPAPDADALEIADQTGTGEPLGRHTHTVKTRNTLWMDRQRPSQIVLPLLGDGDE